MSHVKYKNYSYHPVYFRGQDYPVWVSRFLSDFSVSFRAEEVLTPGGSAYTESPGL